MAGEVKHGVELRWTVYFLSYSVCVTFHLCSAERWCGAANFRVYWSYRAMLWRASENTHTKKHWPSQTDTGHWCMFTAQNTSFLLQPSYWEQQSRSTESSSYKTAFLIFVFYPCLLACFNSLFWSEIDVLSPCLLALRPVICTPKSWRNVRIYNLHSKMVTSSYDSLLFLLYDTFIPPDFKIWLLVNVC